MAPVYLLDTNICIYVRQNRPSVLSRFRSLRPGQAVASVVTYGELAFGAEKSHRREQAIAGLNELLTLLPILPLPADAGMRYGAIRAVLERRGEIISSNDLWIAAHAIAAGLILVTNNDREFRRVPGLNVENWAVPNTP